MQKSGKYIGIVAGILILVVLSSGCISVQESFQNLSNNLSNLQVNEVNGTYYVGNVSFKCPDNWHVETMGGNTVLACPKSSPEISSILSFNPQFQVQIIPNSDFSNYDYVTYNSDNNSNDMVAVDSINSEPVPIGMIMNGNSSNYTVNNSISERQISDIMQNSTDPDWNKISNNTITVDGKKAYETTFIVNSIMPPMIDRKFEQIIFVKNGNTYLILLQAQNWDFNKEKQNFDMILNSFKVQ